MTEHIKYPSLTNSYKEAFIEAIKERNWRQPFDDWVVTEKIHGANFGIYYTDGEIRVASRNQFVDGNFFNNKEWMDANEDKLRTLFGAVNAERRSPCSTIVLFGELFGRGINKGVEYPAGRHFMAFDILALDEAGYKRFLNWQSVDFYTVHAGLRPVPVLKRGTLAECLDYKPLFNSLAGIAVDPTFKPPEDNVAEGLVIRPVNTFYVGHDRAMLKVKNVKFKEVENARPKRNPDGEEVFRGNPDIINYLTTARLDNVLSKEGGVNPPNFNYIVQMFIIDALEDYSIDNVTDIDDKDDLKRLKKVLSRHPAVLGKVRRAFGYE